MSKPNEYILVCMIDDDQEDQTFFSMALQRLNLPHRSVFANSCPEAINLFLSSPDLVPDIIFLDINMPVMNGIECLRELKKIEGLRHVPVYTYSTASDERTAAAAMREGATGVLQKKSSIQELKEMLGVIFSKHHAFAI